MSAEDLAQQRQLLVASAALQRARLVLDVRALRDAYEGSSLPGPAVSGIAQMLLRAALGFFGRSSAPSSSSAWPVWLARGMAIWRAISAIRNWRRGRRR